MIPSIFSDIAPKALLASIAVWAGANYVLIGPEVASRVARADYLPICEGNFKSIMAAAGEERASQVRMPKLDAMQELALRKARELYNSETMDNLRIMSGGRDIFGIDEGARLVLQELLVVRKVEIHFRPFRRLCGRLMLAWRPPYAPCAP